MTNNEVTFAHNASIYGYDNRDVLAAVAAQRLVTLIMESQNNAVSYTHLRAHET